MPNREDPLDKIERRLESIQGELAELKRLIPTWLYQSTQQGEFLDILLRRLDVERGYLPPTRGVSASPDFLLCLASHLLSAQPDITVECGCGVTSVVIGRCLELNGHGKLLSVENDEGHARRTAAAMQEKGLSELARVLHRPLKRHAIAGTEYFWYDLDGIEPEGIQCLIIDGPAVIQENPLARYPAGPVLFPHLAEGATVFLDDYNRKTERVVVERWRREFPRSLLSEEVTEKGCAKLQVFH